MKTFTKQLAVASMVLSASVICCSDKNQTPSKPVVGDGGNGDQGTGGKTSQVATGGSSSASSPSGSEKEGGAAGAANATGGGSPVAGAAGEASTTPCVPSEQGCYACAVPTSPQHFLNQCPSAGITCEKFDNTRIPK